MAYNLTHLQLHPQKNKTQLEDLLHLSRVWTAL